MKCHLFLFFLSFNVLQIETVCDLHEVEVWILEQANEKKKNQSVCHQAVKMKLFHLELPLQLVFIQKKNVPPKDSDFIFFAFTFVAFH